MTMLAKPVLCACLAAISLPATGFAHPLRDPGQDYSQRRNQAPGLSIRDIERRVIPMVPGAQYLGFDYDPSYGVYTLKFMRKRKVRTPEGGEAWVSEVVAVDVQAQTGNVIRRTDR